MGFLTLIGQILLWAGFLVAAFAAVCQLEVPGATAEQKWATVPWTVYGAAMFGGAIGVVVLRVTARAVAEHSDRVEAEYSTITASLAKLNERMAELRSRRSQMSPQDIVEYIDHQFSEPFGDFADARNALVQRFGMEGFANVMTQFASAERFVNRAWSAAADGYLQESFASLDLADGHLQQADGLMSELSRQAELAQG